MDASMHIDELPLHDEVGEGDDWVFQDRYGGVAKLSGYFIGFGSSHRPYHNHAFPPVRKRGQHCSTCRWTEVRIFQEDVPPFRYLVTNSGCSIAEDECKLTTFGFSERATDVIQAVTFWGDNDIPEIPFYAKRALRMAACIDPQGIGKAYPSRLAC